MKVKILMLQNIRPGRLLILDIGIHNYCTTTKMRNEFKQESKFNSSKRP